MPARAIERTSVSEVMSQLLPVECDALTRCRPSLQHNCELFTEQTQIAGKSPGCVAQFCSCRMINKYEIIVCAIKTKAAPESVQESLKAGRKKCLRRVSQSLPPN